MVAAPSLLPDGRSYQWEGSSDPDDGVRAADAPDWLLALVVKAPRPRTGGAVRRGWRAGP